MKKNKVKMKYDPEADVLSMETDRNAAISHAQEMGNVVVHFSKNDRPVLLEVLEASSLFKKTNSPFYLRTSKSTA